MKRKSIFHHHFAAERFNIRQLFRKQLSPAIPIRYHKIEHRRNAFRENITNKLQARGLLPNALQHLRFVIQISVNLIYRAIKEQCLLLALSSTRKKLWRRPIIKTILKTKARTFIHGNPIDGFRMRTTKQPQLRQNDFRMNLNNGQRNRLRKMIIMKKILILANKAFDIMRIHGTLILDIIHHLFGNGIINKAKLVLTAIEKE